MTAPVRIQVILNQPEAARFERYCEVRGHKKSTLIARLVRDHLDREGFVLESGIASGVPAA